VSRNGLDELLRRLIDEDEFRREFQDSRDRVLSSFHLSDQEKASAAVLEVDEFVSSARAFMRPSAPNLPV
jgi:hypothetical protein